MCGITGILNINKKPVQYKILKAMMDSIAHRGPDGEGHYIEDYVGLGHRRLAIIDVGEGGHQPKTTQNKRFTITYNGELYNFRELRSELETKGFKFTTDNDSEVVLQAYACWGKDALLRFNGMFAFAIWDNEDKKLLIARDRFGVKPVYFTQSQSSFLFGSEIKSILANSDYTVQMDVSALNEYLTFQNFFTDRTLFKNISLLPAGHFIEIDQDGERKTTQYWDYDFSPDTTLSYDEAKEELNSLFIDAVKRQLVSDVPVGSYLSGGMDSGSITSIASQEISPLSTFTIGFDLHSASGIELAYDEREKAEHMSYHFGTSHYEMVLKSGDMERCMDKLVFHLEEPRVGQSYPNYYAAHLASKFVKVVLAGAGGDELFGGYPWRYYRAVVNDSFDDYVSKYFQFWQRLISRQDMPLIMSPCWDEAKDTNSLSIFKSVFQTDKPSMSGDDYINHSLYLESKTFLHGLFVVEDKLSMAHGLESRVPFMDNDLVDFAMKLPPTFKLGNLGDVIKLDENEPGPKTKKYFQKTRDGKKILRDATSGFIPEDITKAVKQGFSAPDASWFQGDSINYVKDTLMNQNS
ncbi:MAG: asparagine synthase (glutamine-hydrolyzing), partial [Pseudomonadota bacterium]